MHMCGVILNLLCVGWNIFQQHDFILLIRRKFNCDLYAGFPYLQETDENSLNFAHSLKDLEIPWNFIKYINILENLHLTKINYLIFSLIVIKALTQNKLFPWWNMHTKW